MGLFKPKKQSKLPKGAVPEEQIDEDKLRIIELGINGTDIVIKKAEVAGAFEFVAVLEQLILMVRNKQLTFGNTLKGDIKHTGLDQKAMEKEQKEGKSEEEGK